MVLTNKDTIKDILKENNLWAKKSLGQNFLISQDILNKIINSAKISDTDNIVEVGPGLGVLTNELAKKANLVLIIEKDRKLVELLRKQFKSEKNVKIVCQDILIYDLENINYDYKVVANIPYQITSPLIRKFLTSEKKPQELILMVQKEVAERICAKAGSSERGFLTVLVEFYSKAEIIDYVPSNCFWPEPKVDSAIIKLVTSNKQHGAKNIDTKAFFRLVKIGFSQKRRQIHHPLRYGLNLPKNQIIDILNRAGIEKSLRAEDLSLEDWIKLFNILHSNFNK